MEYALLIDSYRIVNVKPKPILSIDNLAYLCGLFLLIIPFTKLSYYFTFVTLGYFLLVFLFLFMIDLSPISLSLFKKKESLKTEEEKVLKIKIEFNNNLSLDLKFCLGTFTLFLLAYIECSVKKGLAHFLSPPQPG